MIKNAPEFNGSESKGNKKSNIYFNLFQKNVIFEA